MCSVWTSEAAPMDCFWPPKCWRWMFQLRWLAVWEYKKTLTFFSHLSIESLEFSYVMSAIDIVQSVIGIHISVGCRWSSVPRYINSMLSRCNIVIYFKSKNSAKCWKNVTFHRFFMFYSSLWLWPLNWAPIIMWNLSIMRRYWRDQNWKQLPPPVGMCAKTCTLSLLRSASRRVLWNHCKAPCISVRLYITHQL